MINKKHDKLKAIELRKTGLSYSEILKQVSVAKSTLAVWLRSVNLSVVQKQRLTDKKLASAIRGALVKKERRIKLTEQIKKEAKGEIGSLSERERWLLGIALYWAEGSKEKSTHPGSGVRFSNSDPLMIKFFISWLMEICKIPENMIQFELYIHENHKDRLPEVIEYWLHFINSSKEHFRHIYLKKNKIKTKRKNIGNSYYGLIRVKVSSSSGLNRKIAGWIEGIS